MARLNAGCWDREDLLSAYLDGELRAGELEEVVGHLDACENCLSTFHAMKEARAAIRLLPLLDPPSPDLGGYHFGDRLSAYLDGELATTETEAVTIHVSACSECRDELQELDAARTAVRALPRLEVTVDLNEQPDVGYRRSLRRTVLLVAAAAVAAATLGFSMMQDDTVTPLDLDNLATRHNARVSVDPGFSVIPASISPSGTP